MKKAIDYIDEAIAITRQREASCPAFPLYASALIQLDFIRNVLLGTEKDKSRLHRLTIGALAGKEFGETDPDLADALGIAYYIGSQIGRGLKIRLPDGQPLESLHRPAPPTSGVKRLPSTDLQHLYNKAWLFASHAHVGQMMKGSNLPYTTHVAMVANELIFADRESDIGDLSIAMPAALLHDVIEDTAISEEALAEVFGAAVASTVACLSKNLIVPFSDERYFQAIAAHSREAAAIKLCDRITNLQSAPSTWSLEKRASYHEESAQILAALGHTNDYLKRRLTDAMARYKSLYVDEQREQI